MKAAGVDPIPIKVAEITPINIICQQAEIACRELFSNTSLIIADGY